MLKATVKGGYRKNGKLVVVYTVIGTPKELAEFAQARADSQQISLEQFHAKRLENGGAYTYTVSPNAALGITAEKTMTLTITPKGTVVVDNTLQQIAAINEDSVQIRAARNTRIGQVQAEIELGLTNAPTGASSTGNKKLEDKKSDEPVDNFENINKDMNDVHVKEIVDTLED